MLMPTGVATAIIDRTIEVMDTIARIGTIAAMDIIAHIGHTIGAMDIARTTEAMGVRRFTSPYHQFGSPSAAATGNPKAERLQTTVRL